MPTNWDALAPTRLTAIELRSECDGGRSRPLRVQCRAEDGSVVKAVVKLSDPMVPDGTPWRLCLAHELTGAILARHLGLMVPDYAIVEFTDAFARSVGSTPSGERVARSLGPNFGSVVLDNIIEDVPRVADLWEPTITFDALAFNVDRMTPNPNVLWNGLQIFLIDHGLIAPTWTRAVDGLTDTSLYGNVNIRLHAGFVPLKHSSATYSSVSSDWTRLVQPPLLDWIRQQIPASWASTKELDELCTFMKARASISSQQADELRKVIP